MQRFCIGYVHNITVFYCRPTTLKKGAAVNEQVEGILCIIYDSVPSTHAGSEEYSENFVVP